MFQRAVATGGLDSRFEPGLPWTLDVQSRRGRKFGATEGRSDLMSFRLDELHSVASLFHEEFGVPVALTSSIALAHYLRGACRRRGVTLWTGILDQAVEDGLVLLDGKPLQHLFALAEQG